MNPAPPSQKELQQQIQSAIDAAHNAAAEAQTEAALARIQGVGQGFPVPPVPPVAPGAFTIQPGFSDMIPPQAVDIAIGFFVMCAVMVIGYPLARAFGRRIEGRSAAPAQLNPQMAEQLQRIEQAVDAMAVEIERISESQRFVARLQSSNAESRHPAER